MGTVFFCGDVMTGRGLDQALPHPGDPRLQEEWVDDARTYLALAEEANGPIACPLSFDAPWGDALAVLEHAAVDARVVNLETSITRSSAFWPEKGVNYRMSPDNVGCLTAARLDVCALANNHLLDFDRQGLDDTLDQLHAVGIRTAGAGHDLDEALRPAVVGLGRDRALRVTSVGDESSGIPLEWAATRTRSGVALLDSLSDATADALARSATRDRRDADVVGVSIHWGSNWGYDVPRDQIRFAHRLIDGGVDVVHGHSSHHPRPIELYRDRLVLYGCGDLLNDYEGISGHEAYRGELSFLYLATFANDSGALAELRLVPMRIRGFCLHRATFDEALWLRDTLTTASVRFGTTLEGPGPDGTLRLA